jgi:hypothetical protein
MAMQFFAMQGKSKVRWQCHSEERSDEESLRLSPSARETLRYAQGDIASSIRKNATFENALFAMRRSTLYRVDLGVAGCLLRATKPRTSCMRRLGSAAF